MNLNNYLEIKQFSIEKTNKKDVLLHLLSELHHHHYTNSIEYSKIVDTLFPNSSSIKNIEDFPYIPVSVFKEFELRSITQDKIFKVLTSSGTTGSIPSKIFLDRETAQLQTIALSKIITHIIGTARLPMLIVDSKEVLTNRNSYSARGAGILGLSIFGKDHTYVLDENFNFNESIFDDFCQKYCGKPVLIFGFTFMIWQYLINYAHKKKYDLSKATLIHSGGWKKLTEFAIDNSTFKRELKEAWGVDSVYNFYGMVEQVGSIFIENSEGFLHCPNFSDIIIRNPKDLTPQPIGEEGLIQVVSVLPKSYPGYSILTEDIGVCMSEDNTSNGWHGKSFKIIGRAKKSDLRGCSDTFSSKK